MVSDRQVHGGDMMMKYVLILVLMEYGLGQRRQYLFCRVTSVLILVLMEYGLGPDSWQYVADQLHSLNPCFNGIWSRTANNEQIIKTAFQS